MKLSTIQSLLSHNRNRIAYMHMLIDRSKQSYESIINDPDLKTGDEYLFHASKNRDYRKKMTKKLLKLVDIQKDLTRQLSREAYLSNIQEYFASFS